MNIADGNYISTATHGLRPDIVSGVPLINPLYDPGCRTSATCQPYINPAAFVRPAVGSYGSAPRTIDWVRGPWQQTFDLSIQKNWAIGEKRRIQFRADLINVFNHPTFRTGINNGGGTDVFGSAPNFAVTKANVTSYYTAWQTANPGRPAPGTPAGQAAINNLYNMIASYENTAGVLPANFYSIPLPQSFAQANANSYDITTLNGFQLYNLRNTYAQGFGNLSYNVVNVPPRYIQFGIKIFF